MGRGFAEIQSTFADQERVGCFLSKTDVIFPLPCQLLVGKQPEKTNDIISRLPIKTSTYDNWRQPHLTFRKLIIVSSHGFQLHVFVALS